MDKNIELEQIKQELKELRKKIETLEEFLSENQPKRLFDRLDNRLDYVEKFLIKKIKD